MRALVFMMMALAAPAQAADLQCRFTEECIDGEGCGSTDYSVSVEDINSNGRAITFVTDAETLRGQVVETGGPLHMLFVGDTALHLITMSGDLSARYTVHMQGPMAITYRGTCGGKS